MKKFLLVIIIIFSIFTALWFVYKTRKEESVCLNEFLVTGVGTDEEREFQDTYLVDWVQSYATRKESVVVGHAVGEAKFWPRSLFEFLFDSGIIETYSHLGSRLCLIEEDENKNDSLYSM